jgi:hypothetical protein
MAEPFSFSQSKLKTFNRCPKQYEYKYVDHLNPKRKFRPLLVGSWVHRAVQTYYESGDWKIGFNEYKQRNWDNLFEEEREMLSEKGNPAQAIPKIMRGYKFYYRDDGWEPVIVEQEILVETPLKGVFFKGVVDLGIMEDGKLWVIDHKTAGSIPAATTFHAMDPQLILYPWALGVLMKRGEIEERPIGGVIYNYIRSKPPTEPSINKDGTFSKRKIVTDYPTVYLFLTKNGYDPKDFSETLIPLRRRSELLRRYRLPREPVVTKSILLDALSVVRRIQTSNRFTRSVSKDCGWCSYRDLCRADLNGLDTTRMRATDFTTEEDNEHRIDIEPEDEDTED